MDTKRARLPHKGGGGTLCVSAESTPSEMPEGARKENGHPRVAVELVEAAGQLIHPFQGGLDYAFILLPGCGACYPAIQRPDPSDRSGVTPSGSMSLYRAGLRLALFLPLGVAMPPSGGAGFADVSPVFTLPFRAEATVLIEPASAGPAQPGLHA